MMSVAGCEAATVVEQVPAWQQSVAGVYLANAALSVQRVAVWVAICGATGSADGAYESTEELPAFACRRARRSTSSRRTPASRWRR